MPNTLFVETRDHVARLRGLEGLVPPAETDDEGE